MALLESHLEQISLSATAIAELPFQPPKIFTNAMLRVHDITALIRDTEAHERALFSLDPAKSSSSSRTQRRATRRATMFPATEGVGGSGSGEGESMASRIYAARDNRNQSAVARVLGGDMMNEIKKTTGSRAARGEIDVELLLRGAEMLCSVYPISGAPERIATLRHRNQEVTESIAQLEDTVAQQAAQLERMNRSIYSHDYTSLDHTEPEPAVQVTDEDIERELEEIRELERRKRTLEDRVSGMERDLGGLLR
ncbi:hypothetical protein AJ80_05639 [Polytolypa hystricis UAMH7299]|uniref:DASH complex subunit SPC34 n=1 Tax=Polytolypa hystricis (strain UAMH7299) TaxID=1447883 RepID=A0A2B7Y1E7_POLH7|nr:hypothetical protein AJ80_05639 [Polytolypa hystricis UAMH7299]